VPPREGSHLGGRHLQRRGDALDARLQRRGGGTYVLRGRPRSAGRTMSGVDASACDARDEARDCAWRRM
jgi:hypothetical protein